MNKRPRADHVIVRGSKMAKDKSIVEVAAGITSAANAGQAHLGLYPQSTDASQTCNRPLTVSGLRWNISTFQAAALTTGFACKWCIWIRRKGQAIPATTMLSAGAQDAFGQIDESDILVWGMARGVQNDQPNYEGQTKTQRKMQQGDALVISFWTFTGGATDLVNANAVVQTFLKS